MPIARPLTALVLSLALPLASLAVPGEALAAPPEDSEDEAPPERGAEDGSPEDEAPEDEAAPEEDSAIQEASDMFYAGVTRYNAADYEGAIELWISAYDLVEPSFENRLIKAELIYNVARAQQKWFEIDDDVEHLRRSRAILGRYLGELEDLYGDQSGLEREKIEEQIAEVEATISAWEEEQARREAELAERMRPKFDEAADAREARRNKSMIGAGVGLTAIGLGGVSMIVTGIILAGSANRAVPNLELEADISDREAVIRRGRVGNAMIVTGSLAAGIFLTAGLPLIGVGGSAEKQRKQRRVDAGVDEARLDLVSPVWVRGGLGLAFSGRF